VNVAEIKTAELIDALPTAEMPARVLAALARGSGPLESRIVGGRYELVRKLGGGGMADVFEAYDHRLEREVAIKLLRGEMHADQHQLDRFRREAQLLASVKSDRVVEVYDSHVVGHECFLVLRYVRGRNLSQIIDSDGPLSPRRALRVVLDVLDGLRALHAQAIVHRDIKPANVMLDGDDRAVLIDLGVAQDRRRARLTPDMHTVGTPGFMPPELMRTAHVDTRCDLYQVALLLFYLATAIDPRELHTDLITGDLSMRMPGAIASIVARGIAAAELRFQNVEQMADAVHRALKTEETVELSLSDIDTVYEAPSEPAIMLGHPIAAPVLKPLQVAATTRLPALRRHRWRSTLAVVAVATAALWALSERLLDSSSGPTGSTSASVSMPSTIPLVARLDVDTNPAPRQPTPHVNAPVAPAALVSPRPHLTFVRHTQDRGRAPSPARILDVTKPSVAVDVSTDSAARMLHAALADEQHGADEEAIAGFRAYLRTHPDGAAAVLARQHLAAIQR
jgi:serine/threonine protein kinase